MAWKTEDLIKKDPYAFETDEKARDGSFYEALIEELCFHYANNESYKKFCIKKGFDPYGFRGSLGEIPTIQVSVFKSMGRELTSVPKEQIKMTLQSSATSGIPSSVPIDKMTAKRQAKAMVRVIGDFIGNERKPFLIMDVDPESGFKELLGARFAAVSGYLNFASRAGYFLKVDKDKKYYFDIDGISEFIDDLKDEPAVIFGFTYILYSEVIKPLLGKGISFNLPKGSKLIHIGGWKKLENKKVSREEFNRDASYLFGIEESDVIDIYGFTEQMGLNYPDCACGCKHASLYSEVLVRDIATGDILLPGKEGLLEFISPIPHSYPGNAVLTDDVGIIEEGVCPYGRSGTRFKVLGRLKKAEIRGCGDILASKLLFSDKSDIEDIAESYPKYRVEYYSEMEKIKNTKPEESLQEIIDSLKSRIDWIRKQPIDALIGFVDKIAKKWAENEVDAKPELRMNGLGFLSAWCKAEHLTAIVDAGLNGNRMHADSFIPITDDGLQYRKAVSRGLVCHWLAGNVQVLGMFVLIESILTKNVNLLKVSSKDAGVFTALLRVFEGEEYITPGGYRISGDELLKTISVVYYDHNYKKIANMMSEQADVRIAWGGAESVKAVANYPSKYDCEDIIMGPKLSFAVISKESLCDDHRAKKLGRRIGVDASVFDQTGCASAHNLYVERGGVISPEEFIDFLIRGMKKAAVQIPKGEMSAEQIAAVHSVRGIYDFKGEVYGDDDSIWTVLFDNEIEKCSPVYSRVIFVHAVDDIMDVVRLVDENTQTIGLAAEGERALMFAESAANKGTIRFPVCGRMLNFDSPWDGIYLTDRMVRWVVVGGPEI